MNNRNPLHYVHSLGVLLLFFGLMLLNNSATVWQQNQQLSSRNAESWNTVAERREAHKAIQLRLALYIAGSLFLLLLGVHILFKRRWACHFFFSVRQLAQLALVLIPVSTLLFLRNRPLMESLSRLYLPIIQELMQQQGQIESDVSLNIDLLRKVIRTTFWIVAMLGMALATIALRLSSRCLRSDVQQALRERCAPAGHWSLPLLCLPPRMLLVFVLAVYGTVLQLLETVLILSGNDASWFALLLSLGAFAAFALSLLHLVNRNMQEPQEAPKPEASPQEIQQGGQSEDSENAEEPESAGEPQKEEKHEAPGEERREAPSESARQRLLRRAVQFCGLAYLLQLLQSTILRQNKNGWDSAESLDIAALETSMNQISSISNLAVLLLLVWLYYLLHSGAKRD